jgi:hypothetical protein
LEGMRKMRMWFSFYYTLGDKVRRLWNHEVLNSG